MLNIVMAFQEFSTSMQRKENSSNWTFTPLSRNNNNSSKLKINISGKILSFKRGCSLNFKLLVIRRRGFECAYGYSPVLCAVLGTNRPSRKESVYSRLDLESNPFRWSWPKPPKYFWFEPPDLQLDVSVSLVIKSSFAHPC